MFFANEVPWRNDRANDHLVNQATLLLLVTVAVSGVVSLAVSRTTTRYDYKLARQSRAIEYLAPQLYGLQDLVVLARPGMVSGREFSDAILEWNKAWKTHRAGLPRSWGIIYREANDAIGNFAGPHIFFPVDRSVLDEPLADYDWQWQTNARGLSRALGRMCGTA